MTKGEKSSREGELADKKVTSKYWGEKNIQEDITRTLCYWTNEDNQGKTEYLELQLQETHTHTQIVLMYCHTQYAKYSNQTNSLNHIGKKKNVSFKHRGMLRTIIMLMLMTVYVWISWQ